MWTDLQVINLALLRIGVNRQVASIAENSAEAKASYVALPRLKERVLAAHHWAWARAHEALAARTNLVLIPRGWTYAYDPPSLMLAPLEIWGGNRSQTHEERIPFELCVAASAAEMLFQVICTDEPNAELLFVRNLWTNNFVPEIVDDALSWLLAAELAMPIKADLRLAASLGQYASRALQVAIAADRNAAQPDPDPLPRYIRERG